MRVCHVSPTHFSPGSHVGGGERFVDELSSAMAAHASVKLVSFGKHASRKHDAKGRERVVLANRSSDPMLPISAALFRELRGADVIHCHQYFVLSTFLACLYGRLRKRRVFVSDLGGGGWTPGFHIDQSRWIDAHLPISRYAASLLPGRRKAHSVIYAGVNLERYAMRPTPQHDGSVVFLGRILPHKGVHFLLEGLPPETPLHVIGPALDPTYLERLRSLARGKRVELHHGLDDGEVARFLRRAMVLVHPTPTDLDGSAGVNELFGLSLVEAMACGCPVIASRVASLPEIVDDGRTGQLVPANDPGAITRAIEMLRSDYGCWQRFSAAARRSVATRFTWDRVVARCLTAYTTAWGRDRDTKGTGGRHRCAS